MNSTSHITLLLPFVIHARAGCHSTRSRTVIDLILRKEGRFAECWYRSHLPFKTTRGVCHGKALSPGKLQPPVCGAEGRMRISFQKAAFLHTRDPTNFLGPFCICWLHCCVTFLKCQQSFLSFFHVSEPNVGFLIPSFARVLPQCSKNRFSVHVLRKF